LLKKPNKKNQPKRPSQNGWVQIDLSKMALWSSWTWGQKNHLGGFFTKIPNKKTGISYSEGNQFQVYKKFGLSLKEIFKDASPLFHMLWTLGSIGQEVEQHKNVANMFHQMDQYSQHMHVVMLLKTNAN
jgi:hypothetical protein